MSKVTILKPKDIKTTIKNKKTGEIYEKTIRHKTW